MRLNLNQLELNRSQTLKIRVILSHYLLGKDLVGEEHSLEDALFDSEQSFCPDLKIEEVVKNLQGISVEETESLLAALQAQCTHTNNVHTNS
ncbi:hypothetical protein NUACC21_74630 [Scytonema sp. NUACC21]